MSKIVLIRAWTNKKSAIVGLLASAFVLLWPSIPLRSLNLWLQTLFNLFPTVILYPALAFLVGSYVAIYVYNKKVQSCCSIDNARTGLSSSLIGIFLGACPACIPVIAFFLPLTVTVTLSYFSWVFLLGSILVLLFAIYKMNGFRRI